jgi:asparagine synthase (glutamine-hydrolysing)
MFAFAIYDVESRELFLARDRFGIKPLYFWHRNGQFAFASEVRALLASGLVERRLDPASLGAYLRRGSVAQPRTVVRGVSSLAPGCTMRVRSDGSATTTVYWDLADAGARLRPEVRRLDRRTAQLRLREILEEATRLHMIADVPVGAFLSGGIDSTAVVGLMTKVGGTKIRTFSVGFSEETSVQDERAWARIAAERFGCDHSEVVVRGSEVAGNFEALVGAIDQPSLDGTNTFIVARAAGRSLKVALSGLGGDELFAGYPHFGRLRRARRFDRLPRSVQAVVWRLPERLVKDGDFLRRGESARYAELRRLFGEDETRGMLAPELAAAHRQEALEAGDAVSFREDLDSVAQTTYFETRHYLVDTLLRDADSTAMASSLEVRPVLLDHELAEFVFALPESWKVEGRTNKPMLVQATSDILPPEVLTRPKRGFELPLQSWLTGPLRERALGALSSSLAITVLSGKYLQAAEKGLRAGQRPALGLWANVVLIEWLRRNGVEA